MSDNSLELKNRILGIIRTGLLAVFLGASFSGFSQDLINPNFGLASHPMKVRKVSHAGNNTILELSITNQSETGSFCADKNIFVQDVLTGKKYQLIKSKGIPVCPANYQFKYVGEVLIFELHFPKIEANKYITLIEDCDQYCFSIKGIILDDSFNQSVNLGYDYYSKGMLNFALESFKKAVELNPDYPFSLHYMNVIQIYTEINDFASAKIWYKKIIDSAFEDKNEVLERIKNQPYYDRLL